MKRLAMLSAVLALAAACDSDTPITPIVPTPTYVTDVFPLNDPGTLTINGAATHDFSTRTPGDIQAVLTSFGPDSTTNVGLALGTWNGTACQLIIANDNARQSTILSGRATDAGGLCVRIYDVGKMTEPLQYRISVTHP